MRQTTRETAINNSSLLRQIPNSVRLSSKIHPDERRTMSVAVLGAGHGGLALAGQLSLRGFRITLWNRSIDRIAGVKGEGGIHLRAADSAPAFAPISLTTCRIGAALAVADRVLVAVPASGHADIARACAPYLRDHHTVLLMPGRTGGALEFRNVLRNAGCSANILLGETNTFPLAARCTGPASATIFGAKSELLAAALSSQRTPELVDACRPLFPMLSAADSVLHTGLANVGAILHPTITLLNSNRIASGTPFDFYTEGVTPRVAAVLARADAERIRIARAYGIHTNNLQEWVASAYGHRAESVFDAIGGNPSYAGIKAPTTLAHRYLFEDVPTGLIPLIELGRAAGIVSPTLENLVDLARRVNGGPSWSDPRTLGSLGIDGLKPEQIKCLVESESNITPVVPIVRSDADRYDSISIASGV